MKKTALITGVSGQDGAYLAKLLLDKGYRVIGTSRDAQVASLGNLRKLGIVEQIERVSMVPTDFRSTLQTLKRIGPHEIYHLAGPSSVALSFHQPVETMESISLGTLNLLEAIRFLDAPARLYHASSSECFGNTSATPASENTPFHPRSPYGVAKSAAHWAVVNYRESYGLYAANGILFNHESPLRPARFVTRKIIASACRIKAGFQDKLELGSLSIRRDWGWAPEYVEGMWRILQNDTPEDFVLATGQTNSLEEFVALTFKSLDLDWRSHVTRDDSEIRPADIPWSAGDPSRAQARLHWQAQSRMPEVISKMLDAELAELHRQGRPSGQ